MDDDPMRKMIVTEGAEQVVDLISTNLARINDLERSVLKLQQDPTSMPVEDLARFVAQLTIIGRDFGVCAFTLQTIATALDAGNQSGNLDEPPVPPGVFV